ncbi:MAG: cation diffusion facilitator family transporter [Actinomycetes bacterium]
MRAAWRLGLAAVITVALIVVQVCAAYVAHSSSLIADAGHNLVDLASLLLAWFAARVALRPPNAQRTWGHDRPNILAALTSASVLVLVTIAVTVLAVMRLIHPGVVHPTPLLIAAGLGLLGNIFAAYLLHEHAGELNQRSARLHLLGDAGASAAVLLAGLGILLWGSAASRLDPLATLLVAGMLVREGVKIIRESTEILLEASPKGLDSLELRQWLLTSPDIIEVHDLHLWSLGGLRHAMSAHLVVNEEISLSHCNSLAESLRAELGQRFGNVHATFEFEGRGCAEHVDRNE